MLYFIVDSFQSPLATNGDNAVFLIVGLDYGTAVDDFCILATYDITFDWDSNLACRINKACAILTTHGRQAFRKLASVVELRFNDNFTRTSIYIAKSLIISPNILA